MIVCMSTISQSTPVNRIEGCIHGGEGRLESHDEANSSAATKTVLEVYNETSDVLMAFCH